ncbi:MAG: DUF1559 domain-containing protein [bacterium]|nr:DUF1559 domain-containing protein [bacterium]
MPFQFTCPYCFKKTLVDEALAGESGPCAGCGKQITLPRLPTAETPTGIHPAGSAPPPRPARNESRMAGWLLKAIGLVTLVTATAVALLFLFWPIFQSLKERRNKAACMNNLQQIAMALNAYAADHGSYPPPIVYDDQGKPMHSWRVLILGYLGEEALFAQYNFNLPWDSQLNSMLFSRCPKVFVTPGTNQSLAGETSYMLITGNGTLFPTSGPLAPEDIVDGPANTLLVVEVKNNTYEWTKPIDLDAATLNRKIGAGGKNSIGGNHPNGATAAFADGSGAWLPGDLDPVLFDAILTPNGGEPIDTSEFELQ